MKNDVLDFEKIEKEKYHKLYKMCMKWIKNLQTGVDLNDKLKNANVQRVAIYGWGELAWLLYKEINHDIISYVIDKNADSLNIMYPVYSLNSDLPKVDLIIVTVIDQYDKIRNSLLEISDIPVCSMDDLVCEDMWVLNE